jgi:hypothetical protein
MSINVKSFSLKCLKKTISSYTRIALSTNIHTSALRLNYSNIKLRYSSLLYNDASRINKNIRLYSTSPISWDDVDSIIANASSSNEDENTERKMTKGI